eukprot:scaffold276_cov73-Skeletonema_marinoi.AAC.1
MMIYALPPCTINRMEVNDPTSASGKGESMSSRWSCFMEFGSVTKQGRFTGLCPKVLPCAASWSDLGQTLGSGALGCNSSSTSNVL